LDGNVKKAQRAFLVGILIPTLIYFLWIFTVSNYLRNADFQFFNQMIQGTVSPGMLVQKLCSVVGIPWMDTMFKLISLLAILTSAIGIGIGICISLREEQTKINPQILVVIIPCIVNLTFQNAFLKILSFGGAIATVFVIFIPIYLKRKKANITLQDTLCCLFGLLVISLECIDMFLH
jgi:tyrosine-specific transport protein